MKRKIRLGVGFGLLSLVLFAGCGNQEEVTGNAEEQQTEIRLGTTPGPYSELFLKGIKPILEEAGYTVTDISFTGVLEADIALNDGEIDLNVDQHTAYLENFNENTDADLVGITPIPTVPAGLYPGRKDSLTAIEANDTIGIPNDPSNSARALLLLQKAGWIELDPEVAPIDATLRTITDNPYDLDIVEMDSAQIPRSLADLDYAVIPGSIVYSAGIAAEESLLSEDILQEYELVATVKKANKDSDWAQAVVAAYHSEAFKELLAEENQTGYWFIPEELQ